MLDAIIFDFDGIIVDTEPFHHRAFSKVLEPEGLAFSWEEYQKTFMGFDDRDAFREAYRRSGRDLPPELLSTRVQEKAEVFVDLIKRDGVSPYPGVLDLLGALEGEIPLALCSGALRSDVDPILEHLGISPFGVIVTADDVEKSKPHPESYERTLALLRALQGSIRAEKTIVFEDTPTGIRSASGAGLFVVGVTHSHPEPDLHEADYVIDSLTSVTLDACTKWLG